MHKKIHPFHEDDTRIVSLKSYLLCSTVRISYFYKGKTFVKTATYLRSLVIHGYP